MRGNWTLGVILAAGLIGTTMAARADVVFPAPTDCPPGSFGDTHHGGPHCSADLCTEEPARCAANGATCQDHGLCTEQRQGASRGGPFTFTVVVGVCDPEGKCAQGKCEKLKVCVPAAAGSGEGEQATEGAVEAPTPEPVEEAAAEAAAEAEDEVERKGCQVGPAGPMGVGAAVLFALAAVGMGRRRQ